MAEVLLFHHAQGLTTGVVAFADELRGPGTPCTSPTCTTGSTFDTLEEGIGLRRGDRLRRDDRAWGAAADGLPDELVYAGFSLGVMPAQKLAQTRAGARGACCSTPACRCPSSESWPAGVPVQIHGMEADPIFIDEGDVDAARGSSSRRRTPSCSSTPAISTCSPTAACRRTTPTPRRCSPAGARLPRHPLTTASMSAPVRRLSRDEARRIAVRAQLLDADRPQDLLTVVDRLTFLQLDPTAAIAPSADLVAWTRLGERLPAGPPAARRSSGIARCSSTAARTLVTEPILAMVRPMADLGLYLADMAAWPPRTAGTLRMAGGQRRRSAGGCSTSCARRARCVPRHPRHVRAAVGVDGLDERPQRHPDAGVPRRPRRGRRRRASRPATPVGPGRARSTRRERTRRAGGRGAPDPRREAAAIARRRPPAESSAMPARRSRSRARPGRGGSTRRRPPRGSKDARRCCRRSTGSSTTGSGPMELFDFEYTLEMYKPKDKRRWGYFALPVLHHDRLVGKVDATADRKASLLRVHAIHQDVRFTRGMTAEVRAELTALAEWLGLDDVQIGSPG